MEFIGIIALGILYFIMDKSEKERVKEMNETQRDYI